MCLLSFKRMFWRQCTNYFNKLSFCIRDDIFPKSCLFLKHNNCTLVERTKDVKIYRE